MPHILAIRPLAIGTAVLTFATSLHHLIISHHIARDENHLRAESVPRIAQQLHRVGAPTSLLTVPENHALWRDVVVNQRSDDGPKGALLIGANPDEKPEERNGQMGMDGGR